jgi:sulfite exporter TauE/SafE
MNGLMPCAMTLAIAVKATSAAHPLQGGLLMLAFGLGTLPAMVFVSVVFNRLGAGLRGLLLKGAAVVVIGLGVVTLMQGVRFFEVMRHLADW